MKEMKIVGIALILQMVLALPAFSFQEIVLEENDVVDLEEIFEENDIYFKLLSGLDNDGKGFLYFCDQTRSVILKVDANTFELVKTISSKGRGPAELYYPKGIRVKNDLIYVKDIGSGGVKIFDLEGNLKKGIRFFSLTPSPSMVFGASIHELDISSKNEIYVRAEDKKTKTVLSVFDKEGKLLRQMIPMTADMYKDTEKWHDQTSFDLILDQQDNIIKLHMKNGVLIKLKPDGSLIWKKNLYDYLPEGYGTKKKRFETSQKKGFMIKLRLDFYGFILIDGNRIFVSAAKTGMLLNSSGELLALVKPPDKKGFGGHFTWYNGKIYTSQYVFDMKKVKNLK